MTFGTAPGARTTKVVMDSGSANFWVSSWLVLYIHILIDHIDLEYRRNYPLGISISRAIGPCNKTITEGNDNTISPTGVITDVDSGFAYAGNAKIVSGIQYANDTLTVAGGSGPTQCSVLPRKQVSASTKR